MSLRWEGRGLAFRNSAVQSVAPQDARSLRVRRIDVWRIDLTGGPDAFAAAAAVLDQNELARAGRFRFEIHRRRFVLGRAALKATLSEYLDTPAAQIQLTEGARGKPALAQFSRGFVSETAQIQTFYDALAAGALHFNLSHTGDLGLLAVTDIAPVGVDVETLAPVEPGLADVCFSALEQRAWAAWRSDDREAAFYRIWTRKEAILKALGDGLWQPLDAFDVSLDEPPRLLGWRGDADAPNRWRLLHLDPCPGFVGCVALEAGPGPIDLKYYPSPISFGSMR